MKTLAERQADRAQRRADNAAESTNVTVSKVGVAMAALATANDAMRSLSDEERDEVQAKMEEMNFGEAEADEYVDMAGIGVVNPNVLGAATRKKLEATEIQKGNLPEAKIDPSKGNANGQAIAEATNGWGDTGEEKAKAKKASDK